MGKKLLASIKSGMDTRSQASYWDCAQHENATHNNGGENGP